MFKKLNLFLFPLVASLFVQSTFAMEPRDSGATGAASAATDEDADYGTLRIINESLGAIEFEALLELVKANKTIIEIDASRTEITDEQLEAILVQCSNRIETLKCSGCRHIRKLRIVCPNLKRLFLNQCHFLRDLYIDCPRLEWCHLSSCPIDIIHAPDRSTLLRHEITSQE